MRALAIDFETANEQRSSPCSVGLAWIEDGAVIRVEERLIRPKDMRFSRFNIAVHGIRPEHVEDAAEFPEVMEEFEADLSDTLLVAHNASFDMSVLRASYQLYGVSCPSIDYACTLKMAKAVWQDLASHRLNEVSRHRLLVQAPQCGRGRACLRRGGAGGRAQAERVGDARPADQARDDHGPAPCRRLHALFGEAGRQKALSSADGWLKRIDVTGQAG
ncbi:hypothetical protein GGR00_000712 [Aminobacter aganoensis]|uniref:Exonuclease domain-containing protein n=1 Tax=Aminobacter aganoensis TaxID=83264 RepID=A0A7X0F4L1_9HYPH|nr:hypothetical protein [Aminobacter aganoensis]